MREASLISGACPCTRHRNVRTTLAGHCSRLRALFCAPSFEGSATMLTQAQRLVAMFNLLLMYLLQRGSFMFSVTISRLLRLSLAQYMSILSLREITLLSLLLYPRLTKFKGRAGLTPHDPVLIVGSLSLSIAALAYALLPAYLVSAPGDTYIAAAFVYAWTGGSFEISALAARSSVTWRVRNESHRRQARTIASLEYAWPLSSAVGLPLFGALLYVGWLTAWTTFLALSLLVVLGCLLSRSKETVLRKPLFEEKEADSSESSKTITSLTKNNASDDSIVVVVPEHVKPPRRATRHVILFLSSVMLFNMACYMLYSVLPHWLQEVRRWSSLHVGLAAVAGCIFEAAALIGVRHVSNSPKTSGVLVFRKVLLYGSLLAVLSCLWLCTTALDIGRWQHQREHTVYAVVVVLTVMAFVCGVTVMQSTSLIALAGVGFGARTPNRAATSLMRAALAFGLGRCVAAASFELLLGHVGTGGVVLVTGMLHMLGCTCVTLSDNWQTSSSAIEPTKLHRQYEPITIN
ncbi:MAG: hypothetical protein MHM6MM_002176 [Cercozoa sp. M6MM]